MEELFGCWQEARRADRIAADLLRIRTILSIDYYDNVTTVLGEVEQSSRLLRDLHDLFPIYRSRVRIIIYYLQVVLPCLCKTLRDMAIYVDNDSLPPVRQWTLMYDHLNNQGPFTLAERFVTYVEFLVQVIRLLSRSPYYDPTSLDTLRRRILRLRQIRGIPAPPAQVLQPHLAPVQPSLDDLERRHWAEKIFDDQPHSSTGLGHRRDSKCFGPSMTEARLGIPPGSTVLFKLPFDKNRLSVTLYLHAEGSDLTRLLSRWVDRDWNPHYSCYGVHELCIKRRGSSLQFRRWSNNRAHPTLWLALFFKTWERMVLFHCAFVALKARCPLTVSVNPEDYRLSGEKKLFEGKIIDDGFEHSLAVIQDSKCHGLRLHASVWTGELRKCPVWTAFVTYQSASILWLDRRSRHRIWLKDIQPYVFCRKYKKKHQLKKHGDFEIYFADTQAADAFTAVFDDSESDGHIAPGPEVVGG